MTRRLDRDLMNMASPKRVANATLGTLNALQNWRPHEQLLAAAIVFVELAEFYREKPQDAFTVAKNILNDEQGKTRPEFRAVRPYLEGECRLPTQA